MGTSLGAAALGMWNRASAAVGMSNSIGQGGFRYKPDPSWGTGRLRSPGPAPTSPPW